MAVSVTGPDNSAVAEAIRVSVPGSGLRQNLRAVSIVWRREIIRFKSDRLRVVTSLVQPVLFLFVLGTGLSALASRGLPPGIDFRTFIYPGVLSMSVLFTAIFSAASIVWDREFGFLREMLVAPVSRSAIVIGKCLGGATVSTFQGIIILALAGLAHVPYDPILILTVIGELLLLSFTLTAFGVMMAARITQIQAFMALTQMLVMPLFFLSGALYPLRALPAWLAVLTRVDPITYVVYPMRHAVFSHLSISPAANAALSPPITWAGWAVPIGLSLGIVAVMGAVLRVRRSRSSNAPSKGGYAAFPRIYAMTPEEKGDAGWLRGQTTRRRYHRRPDGGPERRQRCPDGGPEHRYEWYTVGPPYVSRPNGNKSRNAILATRLPSRCTSPATKKGGCDRRFLRELVTNGAHASTFDASRRRPAIGRRRTVRAGPGGSPGARGSPGCCRAPGLRSRR
jgi:ABC-2 type transport system permease protein